MSYKINNELGVIQIDSEVIALIAGQTVTECAGVVGMASKNMKDGIVQLLKKESLTKGVHLSQNEDGLTIGVRIIVEYGTNIPAVTETILSNIKYKVEEFAGVAVCRINVFVDGIRVD